MGRQSVSDVGKGVGVGLMGGWQSVMWGRTVRRSLMMERGVRRVGQQMGHVVEHC